MNQTTARFVRGFAIRTVVLAGLAIAACAHTEPPAGGPAEPAIALSTPGWKLVWSDEFNGPSLDASKWKAEDKTLVKNNELQSYSPSAISFHDGSLVITSSVGRKDGRPYTSGLIETRGKFARAFGRFEMRAKLPGTKGLWPAFWLLPADESWPPEIDIMEALGHEPTKVHATNHWGVWPNTQHEGSPLEGPDFTRGFHTFACEWFPDRIDFFIDGVKRATHAKDVPKVPFYVILNTAVGGDWPGNPDATTVLPQTFEVDYVRVYEPVDPALAFLSTSGAGGTVEPSPHRWSFDRGGSVRLAATPDIGNRFVGWDLLPQKSPSGFTTVRSTENPLTLTLRENTSVVAVFEHDPDAPQLISGGKAYSASSAENDQMSAGCAADGNLSTRWSSEFSDPQWLMVDLGQSRSISTVIVRWNNNHGVDHQVQCSDDAIAWRTVFEQKDGPGGVQRHDVNTVGRYVRVLGTKRASQWGYSIFEFEVYGR